MKRKCLLKVVASIILAATIAQPICAQDFVGVEISQTSTLPITGVTESTDGKYNFKSFEVEAAESGEYYTEFWLLPARYANDSYTTFGVYLNNNYVGTITTMSGNWQSARVDGHETFNLSEGTNVITIATPAPEFPAVETLKVSLNDSDATFSPDAYEEYLSEALVGTTYDVSEEELSMHAYDAMGVDISHYSNVPLNYTFYKIITYTEDQEIFITSSSTAEHKLDIVYFGTTPLPSVFFPTDPNPSFPYPIVIGPLARNPGDIAPQTTTYPYIKLRGIYVPATSEEMQGLSWMYPSEKVLNSSMQVATARLTIPKSGQYLIRVRHAVSGSSSVADININGVYYYENLPITLSYRDCIIPADENAYETFTICNNFGTDDPFLYIHGGGCDKIVGFNDDAPSAKREQYDLSAWDSYICQKYFMNTTGVSVNNFSSSNPRSRCSIIARIPESEAQNVATMRAAAKTSGVSRTLNIGEQISISGPASINGLITVVANETIRKITVFGLAGNCIASVNCKESYANIPASSLNITQPGLFIISVETANGITSKKIAIKY